MVFGPSGRLVPAAGAWVMLAMPQLSVAVTNAARFGAGTTQDAFAFTVPLDGQLVITGRIGSFTVTVALQVAVRPIRSVMVRVNEVLGISALPNVVLEAARL